MSESHDQTTWPPQLPPPQFPRGDHNANPPDIGFWALLREDLRTQEGNLFDQGFWAIAAHRFGNWRMGIRWKILRAPLTLLHRIMTKLVEWLCGIKLSYTVKLGRRVRIWHFGGMVLGAQEIGNDVHIRQNTTFGVARRGEVGKPIIEDRVDIGCGAVILGHIVIGHDSVIGANAVVLDHVPPHSLAAGIPAKVIKRLERKAPTAETPQSNDEKRPDTKDEDSADSTSSTSAA